MVNFRSTALLPIRSDMVDDLKQDRLAVIAISLAICSTRVVGTGQPYRRAPFLPSYLDARTGSAKA
jgi:hypothetical protein